MSTYRIHFTWNEKNRIIESRSLDMTHPYFVSITGLIFPEKSAVIIAPDADELRREFGDADHLMIPFQSVQLIEEYTAQQQNTHSHETGKVIPFTGKEHEDDE
ncbi:MAG: DUF1820 family protein [Spirochaeta sp.]|jgi:hypothetical protein|nr:DUF1820 family protein [Spirochaeta sp.]